MIRPHPSSSTTACPTFFFVRALWWISYAYLQRTFKENTRKKENEHIFLVVYIKDKCCCGPWNTSIIVGKRVLLLPTLSLGGVRRKKAISVVDSKAFRFCGEQTQRYQPDRDSLFVFCLPPDSFLRWLTTIHPNYYRCILLLTDPSFFIGILCSVSSALTCMLRSDQ